jgi:hypothetical protein
MSFHFYLYRADEGLPPLNQWSELHAEPLGSLEQVSAGLGALFPQIRWEPLGDAWHGFGTGDNAEYPYLDVLLSEDAPGQCHFVVLNKAPPSVMRKIVGHMHLNYVCAPESGTLLDPWAYEDGDR